MPESRASASAAAGGSAPTPLHVLVVEDVEAMQGLLEHVLAGLELTVAGARRVLKLAGLAKNSMEARLVLTRRRPDLVLLDEILPGESSVDLLLDLHAQGIPTLLLTSLADATHAIPPEAKGRLVKPGWKLIEQDRTRLRTQLEKALTP